MIRIGVSQNRNKTQNSLRKITRGDIWADLNRLGAEGVRALASATPVETSLSKNSWTYKVVRGKKRSGISWHNTNDVNGTPVVILLQYGHGTGTGGYVAGRDFINPAIQPIFDRIAENVWKKVTIA